MRAIAIQKGKFEHEVRIREHRLTADEPQDVGGKDVGPSPQEMLAAALASCTSITMQMYAERKGWDMTGTEVECEYQPGERGRTANFELVLRLPESLTEEQAERLKIIAAKCPVHRTLEGEVAFEERVQRVAPV